MISQHAGKQFEALFHRAAIRQSIGILRIPDGCKRVGIKKLIPVKTPCDFILVREGCVSLIDTKTQGSGQTFPKANINLDQVNSIQSMALHGASGGYVTWFRDKNKVVFYTSEILKQATQGLHWEQGIDLGTIETMDLTKMFWQKVNV